MCTLQEDRRQKTADASGSQASGFSRQDKNSAIHASNQCGQRQNSSCDSCPFVKIRGYFIFNLQNPRNWCLTVDFQALAGVFHVLTVIFQTQRTIPGVRRNILRSQRHLLWSQGKILRGQWKILWSQWNTLRGRRIVLGGRRTIRGGRRDIAGGKRGIAGGRRPQQSKALWVL
jgi:hypothetical protein